MQYTYHKDCLNSNKLSVTVDYAFIIHNTATCFTWITFCAQVSITPIGTQRPGWVGPSVWVLMRLFYRTVLLARSRFNGTVSLQLVSNQANLWALPETSDKPPTAFPLDSITLHTVPKWEVYLCICHKLHIKILCTNTANSGQQVTSSCCFVVIPQRLL